MCDIKNWDFCKECFKMKFWNPIIKNDEYVVFVNLLRNKLEFNKVE